MIGQLFPILKPCWLIQTILSPYFLVTYKLRKNRIENCSLGNKTFDPNEDVRPPPYNDQLPHLPPVSESSDKLDLVSDGNETIKFSGLLEIICETGDGEDCVDCGSESSWVGRDGMLDYQPLIGQLRPTT